jgi:protein SCO1/2
MKNRVWVLFFVAVIAIPLGAFSAMRWYDNNLATLPYYHQGTSVESESAAHFTVPAFAFVNQDSSALNSNFIKGKVWVINYFFTSCPTICPKIMAAMGEIQKAFPNDGQVGLISLTVDPYHDTPAKLKQYAALKNIDTLHWQLGTGDKTTLYRFARHGLFMTADDGDGGAGDFIHSDKLVLIDRENHIRGYYDGTDTDEVNQLIKDIKRLKKRS